MTNLKNYFWLCFLFVTSVAIISCGDDDDNMIIEPEPEPEPSNEIIISTGANASDSAQLAFIEVETGKTIIFQEGTYSFSNTLSMDGKDEVIIKGAGRDKTFLDFSEQTAGGDGVLVTNSNNIRFEDLTVRNSKGDGLKARDCNKVSFVNVGTVWSGEPSTENGAYGLYPVLCTEVYIDNCYAYGASDAGIYVGQSDKVILKNCVAEGNVAGIEIENTTNADVFDNEAFDNTGGLLVFDLPGLTQFGSGTRLYNNNCYNNNRINFAPAGNIVANVPIGTGCMVLSTKNVEIFNNTFTNNNFANILISNYLFINSSPDDPNYNPFPSDIYIHDNTLSLTPSAVNVNDQTASTQAILGLLEASNLEQPNILTDGLIVSPETICIQQENTTFVNINAGDPTFMSVTTDMSVHDCTRDPLPEISFDPF